MCIRSLLPPYLPFLTLTSFYPSVRLPNPAMKFHERLQVLIRESFPCVQLLSRPHVLLITPCQIWISEYYLLINQLVYLLSEPLWELYCAITEGDIGKQVSKTSNSTAVAWTQYISISFTSLVLGLLLLTVCRRCKNRKRSAFLLLAHKVYWSFRVFMFSFNYWDNNLDLERHISR